MSRISIPWPAGDPGWPRPGSAGVAWRVALTGALLGASLASALAIRSFGFDASSVVLVFVVGVAATAFAAGRWYSVGASLLSVLAYNFFFTYPLHTFAVAEPRSVFTFGILLATAVTISELVARLRVQAALAVSQARVNHALYRIAEGLTSCSDVRAMAEGVTTAVTRWLCMRAAVVLADRKPLEGAVLGDPEVLTGAEAEGGAGRSWPGPVRFSLPSSDGGSLGVLVVEFAQAPSERARRVLASIAGQLALAIERQVHSLAAHENAIRIEAERLRTNLLATVSHDLRTPLSAICGTASALLEGGEAIPPAEARELLGEILGESERMARLVENLLQLARMEGTVHVHKQLYPLDELLGAAVARLGRGAGTGWVRFELEDELPLVPVDAELMTSVFQNLLDNALRHAPRSDVLVRASAGEHALRVEVLDRGPGLPAGESQRLFERFFRGRSAADRTRGSGLGLAICKAVMRAHDGWIRAEDRPGGGARFLLELPLPARAPGPAGQLQGIAGAP